MTPGPTRTELVEAEELLRKSLLKSSPDFLVDKIFRLDAANKRLVSGYEALEARAKELRKALIEISELQGQDDPGFAASPDYWAGVGEAGDIADRALAGLQRPTDQQGRGMRIETVNDERMRIWVCEKGHVDDHHYDNSPYEQRCSRCGGATEEQTVAGLVAALAAETRRAEDWRGEAWRCYKAAGCHVDEGEDARHLSPGDAVQGVEALREESDEADDRLVEAERLLGIARSALERIAEYPDNLDPDFGEVSKFEIADAALVQLPQEGSERS